MNRSRLLLAMLAVAVVTTIAVGRSALADPHDTAVAQLRQHVERLDAEVRAGKARDAETRSQIAANAKTMADQKQQIDKLQAQLTEEKKQIEKLQSQVASDETALTNQTAELHGQIVELRKRIAALEKPAPSTSTP